MIHFTITFDLELLFIGHLMVLVCRMSPLENFGVETLSINNDGSYQHKDQDMTQFIVWSSGLSVSVRESACNI